MRKLFLGILIVVSLTTLFWGTNATSPDIIYWSSDYKLTWDDFEGDPNYKHNYKDISAITVSGIVDYRGCEDGKIIYMIKSYFEKKNSWVKLSGRNAHTLAHEQMHFDITELYARKLRKALSERAFSCGQEADFENFVNNFLKGWQKMQEQYDIETGYSNKKEQQRVWNRRIKAELDALDSYKSK